MEFDYRRLYLLELPDAPDDAYIPPEPYRARDPYSFTTNQC
jgi:hypothetical protein